MVEKMRQLEGKVAIVTGGGTGIGRAIAMAYARAGAAVCCAGRTASTIEETAGAVRRAGGKAIACQTDVTKLQTVQRLFEETASAFGGLDILVVSAGGNYHRLPVEESDPGEWAATLEVNLTGAYLCARAAIPHLRQRGAGKIIMIGSGNGHRGIAGGSAYACSKAGLWMLTRVLAQEVWQYNISVNELIPGPVDTGRTQAYSSETESVFQIESEWVKQPEDVTGLAIFLATQPDKGPTAQSFSLMRRDG